MATHANSTPAPARRQPPPIIVDRRKVASAIERLIAILDALDPDPALEREECAELAWQAEIRGGARVRAVA